MAGEDDEGGRRDDERWMRLLGWLAAEHNMDISNAGLLVETRTVPDAGRGLFARDACPPSTTLFTIPANAMINVKTLFHIYPPIGKLSLKPIQMITLHLLLHKPTKDEESLDPMFGPFISTMPREFDSHPLSWAIETLSGSKEQELYDLLLGLLPQDVLIALESLKKRFLEDWSAVSGYMRENPTIPPSSSRPEIQVGSTCTSDKSLQRDYLWAWLNVNTRCIYYRLDPNPSAAENVTLCPILDFANHAPSRTHITPVAVSSIFPPTPGSSKKKSKYLGGDYTFVSSSEFSIVKDEELFLKYGAHSNRTLFIEYGFVNGWELGDCRSGQFNGEVDVEAHVMELFKARGDVGAWMRELLEEEGYWGDWTMHSSPSPAYPSYRLMVALRLYHLLDEHGELFGRKDDPKLSKRVQRWRSMVAGYTETIDESNEQAWRKTLLTICESINAEARRCMHKLDLDSAKLTGARPRWLPWALSNIRLLWQEAREVAEAVSDSIHSGQGF